MTQAPLTAVISARRPLAPEAMNLFLETAPGPVRWYVDYGEAADYRAAGAVEVIEVGGLVQARNAALADAFAEGRACVQVSDDLRRLRRHSAIGGGAAGLGEVIEAMSVACAETGATLAGLPPTDNEFYTPADPRYRHGVFIVGDLIFVRPSPQRFDRQLRLKEDYDFTVQHDQAAGAVRVQTYLASFAHRDNRGGAVSYRTMEAEAEAIGYLMHKWPGRFRLNGRRPGEILMRRPARRRAA
ncbi:hypothetical protein AB0M72_03600 [Nocardiopsis dassonvillei]